MFDTIKNVTFKHHMIISSKYNFLTSDLVKKFAIKNTAATAHASFERQYSLHTFKILKYTSKYNQNTIY